jgi:hypothetical protein
VNYWNGDGFEFFIGLEEANRERTAYAPMDFHLFVGLGPTPGWAVQSSAGTTTRDPIGNNLAITNVPNGYIFELQIPWTTLSPGLTVREGQAISWYMFANNSTVESPSAQQVALGPTGITGPSGNPSRWIKGVLDLRLP